MGMSQILILRSWGYVRWRDAVKLWWRKLVIWTSDCAKHERVRWNWQIELYNADEEVLPSWYILCYSREAHSSSTHLIVTNSLSV